MNEATCALCKKSCFVSAEWWELNCISTDTGWDTGHQFITGEVPFNIMHVFGEHPEGRHTDVAEPANC